MAWINLPDGNHIDHVLVRSVMLYQGKGIALRDAQQRLIAFVRIEDVENAQRGRDLLLDRVKNPRSTDIDWSYLNQTSWRSINEANELPTDATEVN